MSVQGDGANTYDASANIIIGIDDTVPLGGITVPDVKPALPHTAGEDSAGGAGGQSSRQDPYGVGLTESELSYVSTENRMILIEVRASAVRKGNNCCGSRVLLCAVL